MRLARVHRRLAVLAALAALGALTGGAGLMTPTLPGAAIALVLALFWQPRSEVGRVLDRLWLLAALLLVARAALALAAAAEIEVTPWIDLLLVLLVAEALRPLDAVNDSRLYGLSFALIVAATAYRPGLGFALAFAAYAGFTTVALMVGFMRRQAERYDARNVRLSRSLLVTTAALSIVTLLFSAVVFLTFPRVARGWMTRNVGAGEVVAGFGDDVSIAEHGSEIQTNNEPALRVEFEGPPPRELAALHWRGRSFDYFDGRRWFASPDLPEAAPLPGAYALRWPGGTIGYTVFAAPLAQRVIFTLHPVLAVQPRTPINPYLNNAGDAAYHGEGAPVYRAVSKARRPPLDELRAASLGPTPAGEHYLQLPRLPRRVHALADSLTRGATSRYDAVDAVQSYLREEFGYTRQLPESALDATLDAFLFQRRAGHCEYFSTAMVVLLRAAGIPARNVTGFLGGEWNEFGRYLLVRQDRAHSWVEVWFPGIGWVEFDPTPGGVAEALDQRNERLAGLWMLLDGMQHRWEKWVLDYNLQRQVELLQSVSNFFSANRESGARTPVARPDWKRILGGLLLAGIAALILWLLRGIARGGPDLGEAGRIYLDLRRTYQRAGFAAAEEQPPLEFLAALETAAAPGREHAARLVDLYARTRFGQRPFNETTRRAMRESLRRARAELSARKIAA